MNRNFHYFKSALAFFFLFFLHGFSIGNGQQGITHNVSGVYEVGAFKAQMFIPPQKFNRSINVDCLIVSPNLINTLLAVVAVLQGQTLKQWKIYSKTLVK